MTTTNAVITMASALTMFALTGCQETSSRATDRSPAPVESSRVVIEGKVPTDKQKQTMLAAKDALFAKLSGRLIGAMGNEGPAGAIAVCQQEATKIAAYVSNEHQLKIARTGVRLRNLANQPPEWAKVMTDKKTDTPAFVVLDNGDSAALLPIKLQTQCLMCHGPKSQIPSVIQEQLTKLYPDDQATGFNEGDLRGWFWIELPASTM